MSTETEASAQTAALKPNVIGTACPFCQTMFRDALGAVTQTPPKLLDIAQTPGGATEAGLRSDIRVALLYIESWLAGQGAVGVDNMMEDAATAEISRAQVWQWIANGVKLDDGRLVDRDLVRQVIGEELARIRGEFGDDRFESGRFTDAEKLFDDMALSEEFTEFLTLPSYEQMP